ncbi:serine/arginine-rich splicing factor SC35 [Tanacetum coccineum]
MSHFGRSGPPDISDTYSLLILNISFRTTANDLFPLFDKYGKVVDIFIPKDRSRIQSSLMEYAAIEERQLLKKVTELLGGYNNSKWSTRKWCRALGYFEADVLASRVLPKFKSSTPNYRRVLLFTKPIADAPKPITDDIKKYADAVYVSGFTIETFSMMPDFYSDPYTKLISLSAAGIDGAIIDTPKTASTARNNVPLAVPPFLYAINSYLKCIVVQGTLFTKHDFKAAFVKARKGFIRQAMETDSPVVPVFTFGQGKASTDDSGYKDTRA